MASVTENVRQLDSSKCRICMFAKPNLSPLFRRGLSMKVMKLAEIKMYEGDGLPSTICLDCEMEVNRCVNFIAQIQRADVKLREMLEKGKEFKDIFEREQEVGEQEVGEVDEQEASTSQIEIEEFNVKQEIYVDNFLDEVEDAHSESDHDHFGDGIENDEQAEDEIELNPLNHVDVVEDRKRAEGMDVSSDPLGQEEPIIESQNNESDPGLDPLNCMKQEAVSMDIDKDTHEASASTSSVETTVASMPCTPSPQLLSRTKDVVRTEVLQGNGHNRVSIEQYQNLIPENVFGESSGAITDFNTFGFTIGSTQQSISDASNKPKGSCRKLRKTPRQTKSTLLSKKDSSEKTLAPKTEGRQSDSETFCLVCNVSFSSLESLEEHKEAKGFLCRVCTAEFETHDELETHFFSHNTIRCQVCKDAFFSMKDLITHKNKMHTANTFECKICHRIFTTTYGLYKHKRLTHGEGDDSCGCVVCGKSYKCSFQLKQHLALSHTVYENVECKFCHMLYLGPVKLQAHVKKIHLDSEENTPISCLTCGKVFNRASLLMKHMETHENTESVCDICGKSIKTKSLMTSHMAMQHSKTGTFTCQICNEQFGVKKALRMHQRKHHQKRSKPVFCEICGKQYKSSQILKLHKVTHADERPFKCEVCDASFKLAVTLRTHRRVHSSVGKYTCNGCGISFKWKQTYDKHINKCEDMDGDCEIPFEND